MLSDVPVLLYDDSYYSGEAFYSGLKYDKPKKEHPYVDELIRGNSFFDNEYLVIGVLVFILSEYKDQDI
jgi:hypothetical protein